MVKPPDENGLRIKEKDHCAVLGAGLGAGLDALGEINDDAIPASPRGALVS
jgi:hypothetical protein